MSWVFCVLYLPWVRTVSFRQAPPLYCCTVFTPASLVPAKIAIVPKCTSSPQSTRSCQLFAALSSSTDDSPFIIPSFLNSIVYDGLSENRLYAINTNNNVIKVRRSGQGFVFSRCVGLQTFINGRSVKKGTHGLRGGIWQRVIGIWKATPMAHSRRRVLPFSSPTPPIRPHHIIPAIANSTCPIIDIA